MAQHEPNAPSSSAPQCTASLGPKRGRCPNPATGRYPNKHAIDGGVRVTYLNRCESHPMRGVAREPLPAVLDLMAALKTSLDAAKRAATRDDALIELSNFPR